MQMLIVLALASLLSSCAIGAPRWATPGAHLVDGYWLAEERACTDDVLDSPCAHGVPLASEALLAEEPEAVIAKASMAQAARDWIDAAGERHVLMHTGVGGKALIVLDLADGRRRVMGIACPIGARQQGFPVCQLSEVGAHAEGEEPWQRR